MSDARRRVHLSWWTNRFACSRLYYWGAEITNAREHVTCLGCLAWLDNRADRAQGVALDKEDANE